MLSRRFLASVVIIGFCSAFVSGQEKPAASSSSPPPLLREFPMVLQQSVEAGKTPVGTKIQGKLAMATMFHGTAIPRDAIVSGVIFESVRKSANGPSRLGIRMESANWKDRATCMMKAYLMPLYYPMTSQSVQGPPDGSADLDPRSINSPGQSSSPMHQQPFPDNSAAMQGAIPDIPMLSSRPVSMKNVAIEPGDNGGVVLVSEHSNIKLNKMTTYVLAGMETPAK